MINPTIIDAPFPTGSIIMFGAAVAPPGWVLCDGSAISRTGFANLFNTIGTNFGAGNGTTTFNVPNFNATARFPQGTNATPGTTGGNASLVIAHTHTLANHVHAPDTHNHEQASDIGATGIGNVASGGVNGIINNTAPTIFTQGINGASNTGVSNPNTSDSTGTGTDSRPPFLSVAFIIKT